MINIDNYCLDTLKKYFATLRSFGVYPYRNVGFILAILFINEILHLETRFFITEDDYRAIYQALYKLTNKDCVIGPLELNELIATIDTVADYNDNNIRKSETDILRNSEFSEFRAVSK